MIDARSRAFFISAPLGKIQYRTPSNAVSRSAGDSDAVLPPSASACGSLWPMSRDATKSAPIISAAMAMCFIYKTRYRRADGKILAGIKKRPPRYKKHRAPLLQRAPRAARDRTGALRLRLEPPLQPRLRPVRARRDGGGAERFPPPLAPSAPRHGALPIPCASSWPRAGVPVSASPASHPALGRRAAPAWPFDL